MTKQQLKEYGETIGVKLNLKNKKDVLIEELNKATTKESVVKNISSETIKTDFDRMTFTESIKTCFNKYATFSGRASRSEYWWFFLFSFVVQTLGGIIFPSTYSDNLSAIEIILALVLFLPSIAVSIRRLHDVDKSGWWLLSPYIAGAFASVAAFIINAVTGWGERLDFYLVPTALAGFIMILYVCWLFIKAGNEGENQYGENPLKIV